MALRKKSFCLQSGNHSSPFTESMEAIVSISAIQNVTHDVKSFRCSKPEGYQYHPGQATEVSINKGAWKDERRPFTFTSLNDADELEFIIKIYPDHEGVTNELDKLRPGDELIVRDVWGAIEYKGPGYFIAGGAGITPFIAIFRQLKKEKRLTENKLLFSNKTDRDIILENELTDLLGDNAVYTITDDPDSRHATGLIDEEFLKKNITDIHKHFYICGPSKMVKAMEKILTEMGASSEAVVFEK